MQGLEKWLGEFINSAIAKLKMIIDNDNTHTKMEIEINVDITIYSLMLSPQNKTI